MGRGRQKAKQTKVARKLKYYAPETDLSALERELSNQGTDEAEEDPYARYAKEYYDEDEWLPQSR